MHRTQRGNSRIATRFLIGWFFALYLAQHLIFLKLTVSHDKYPLSVVDPKGQQRKQQSLPSSISLNMDVEIRKSLDYVHSAKDTTRKLLFVHIPKTAGTMIESVGGLQAKLPWGSCLFNHKPKRRGGVCRYPKGQFEWPTKVGWWHLPSHFFPLMGVNPYDGAEVFGVVRDPLDRLVSEFYYICRKKKNNNWDQVECNQTLIHESSYLNEWLQFKLSNLLSNRSSSEGYLFDNGHYTPQYDFAVAKAGVRTLDYVLRMDDLQSEFRKLVKAYAIKVSVPENKINAARNDTRDLTVKHLDGSTLALVRQSYEHDFELVSLGT